MIANQTASASLHPPVVMSGVSTGGESRGLFADMKSPAQYEARIAELEAMTAKLKDQLTKALEAVAVAHGYKIQLTKAS